jgi:basic membrane protein A
MTLPGHLFWLILLLMLLIVMVACQNGSIPKGFLPTVTATLAVASTKEGTPIPKATEVTETPTPTIRSDKRYGLVTYGDVDSGLSQLAWLGMQRAARELGLEVSFLQSESPAAYKDNIDEFLGKGYDGIVVIGFGISDTIKTASEAFPEVPFAIIDYPSQTAGDMGLLFDVDQPAFLAGYLAAGMSETGIVCTYGGQKIPSVLIYMVGFEQGVNYYNDRNGQQVKVLGWKTDPFTRDGGDGSFTYDFENITSGRRFAENFFDEGCDIIFPVAGLTGLGSAAAAQERSRAVIGIDTGHYEMAPEYNDVYLTSVVKHLDQAVFEAVKRMEEGIFEGGTNYRGTLENGGVGLAPFYSYEDRVPQTLRDELAEVEQDIIESSIFTGWPVEIVQPPPDEPDSEADGADNNAGNE